MQRGRGNKVRECRVLKYLTQDDIYFLSKRRISQTRVSRIERGVYPPTEKEKRILSRILKTPVNELFPEEE